MNIRQTAIPRRVLSLALCAAMVLTLLPLPTQAEGICNHHREHTADCGYKAAVEGQDCAHSHDSLCGYQEARACTHSHDESCGYREARACAHRHTEECGENGESCTHQHDEACGHQEASPCTHSHDESCGYREASPCKHEHDGSCGYVEAVTGSPCTYRCEICAQQASQQQNGQDLCTHGNESAACETCASEKKVTEVQALINALPETVTEETREAAQSALSAVEEAKAALTEAEQEKLDLTRCTALKALLAEPEAVDTGKVLTDWEWVDDYELIDPKTGLAHLPFASAENIAYYDAVIEVLPAAITANEEELTLGDWLCEDYPMESGAYEGEYVFETTLPEGYVLEDGTNVLRLTVVLGDPEGEDVAWYSEYSTPTQGTHTINGESYSDVYELKSANDLFWFAEKVNTGITVDGNINAVLMNDIRVPEGKDWTPIGGKDTSYGNSSFIGKFDGQGHVIKGLKNTDDGNYRQVGLFGMVGSAVIVNVGIENSTFTAKNSNCGSLIGSAVGSTNGNTIVKNCYSTAVVSSNIDGISVGGLVGRAANLSIQSCYFAGTVSGTGANTGSMIGYGSNPIVRNCYYDTNKCSLSGCGGSGSEYIVGKTTAQFQSGEVAYTLCNGASIWGQNLAGGEFYPKLYQEPHNYKVYSGSQYHNHTDGSQSACLICGGLKPVNGEYQISTKDQLYWFAALVNGTDGLTKNSSAKGVLTADIQVDSGWTPIGSSGFTGSFNGQNHTVTIPAGKSLFDKIESAATVSKVSVSGGNLCNSNSGTIANCCASGTGSVKLCGSNSGTIQNCYAAGGSGTTLASGGTITNCYVKAGTSESAVSGTGITQGDFQSGKVAYLLNKDGCWGQTVNSDSLPKLGGKQVFFKEGGSPAYHNHNGYCNICLKKPSNSDGTSGNWQISNVDELYWYAKLINGELEGTTNYSKNAVLTADITVNTGVLNPDGTLNESGKDSLVKWTPIGKEQKDTNTVTFNGNGHTISGLYCDSGYLVGLFGYLYNSTIQNVIISDSYFSGSYVGGVCGQMNASTITNCFSSSMVKGGSGVGGICGSLAAIINPGTISNCASSGRVNYTSINNNGGGVCGSSGTKGTITNCYYDKDKYTGTAIGSGNGTNVEGKTTKEFASGEVAYLLNGSRDNGTWKQNLDTGTRDETPNFSGAGVYRATSGACTPGYTNNASLVKNHVFENHVCVFCDKRDQDPVIVSGITANSKTYDGGTSASLNCNSAVLINTVTGETVTGVTVSATGTFDKADVGTWNVTISNLELTCADAGKYYLAESGQQTTATATINPRNITVNITPNGGTYGNVTAATANLNDVVSGDTVPVTLTYTGPANDGTDYSGTTAPKKAGSYTVAATISNGNYKLTGTTTAEFVIDKATVTTPTISSKKYTGQLLTADVPDNPLYTVKTNKGGTDVGTYTVVLSLTDSNNYKWDAPNGQTIFRITKAANNWTVDPAITGWTYGENASNPTMGSAKFGEAQVTYLQGETVLDAVPTNAGSYTARFSVAETDNYDGLTKDVPFTISPRPVTVSGITAENKTYDGNTTATLNYDGVTFTGKLEGDSLSVTATGTFESVNAAENKTVTISGLTLGGDSKNNYTLAANGQQTTATATITSKSLSGDDITVTATNPTYNGAQQSPTVAVTYGEITLAGGTDYELTGNTGTDAGGYTLTVTGKGNYSGSKEQGWEIAKASITPVVSLGDTVYGDALSPSVSGNPGNGEVTYTYYSDETCTDAVTPRNAGTYYVRAAVAQTANYQSGKSVPVSFRITQKPVTVSGITAGDKTYDGNTTATLNYDGVTFTGKLEGDSLSVTATGTFESVNAAENKTVTISGLTLGGDSKNNYTLAANGQQTAATATITKANASVTKAPEDAKSLYSGLDEPLVTEGTAQGGTMMYRLGEDGSWTELLPQAAAHGEYTVYYYVKGDGNHEDTAQQSLKARIRPFEITGQTEAGSIKYGESTELSVTLNDKATDVSGITYQWCLVTGEDGKEIYTPLEGETGKELTLTKPNAGKYVYACIITCGDYSETSGKATVTVTAVQKDLTSTSDLPSGLWVEGGEMPLVDNSIHLKSPSSFLLTSYTYNGASTDVHQNYPTGMEVYSVGTDDQGQTTVAPVADLNNLLRYSGCSIRITGKPGIRMITSLTKEAKAALKKGELAGYTLEEYGTVAVWSSDLDNQPLTLKTKKSRSNYAYKRGVSDPVFANVGALTQYTNVLVWDSLEAKKYDEDIVMRPYIKLINKAGETVVLYGGTVSRSIGYVAQQNANTFSKGTAGYKYVHEIIDKVNALHSSTETNTTGG